ncbi:chlorophyll synthesis pathway protein BchC [Salinisphaera sp. Q1T1-3]|uniref:chlorophyll synthesis pathway protein BchC n=1 Tax=Salinisphaera sp. Q1T1-3 TaxID=2321229 RepID=UPI000E745B18|nr:chlorophyll synthesis pathway protein BchC [Salinisphaera sp. Q1T1-3]RJS92099.1 chlorophyll synthesis pathway protein BchC [Salinisphaera sp. Q1T1-3]
MNSRAVVIDRPETLAVRELGLDAPGDMDLVVDIRFSGISTGTERLLYDGRMPHFPGLAYPLVPGYESVGVVSDAGAGAAEWIGRTVFVPGSRGFVGAHGLFGGAASRVVVPAARVTPIGDDLGERGVLLALAATAHHALHPQGSDSAPVLPDLIVGHGVVGRLVARLCLALGGSGPRVWEHETRRRTDHEGYTVCDPADDETTGYVCVVDASGDAAVVDSIVPKLAHGGEVVLAGFYPGRVGFAFAPAFMREARIRIAAEWQPSDMASTLRLVERGLLSLDGLISHRHGAGDAATAYRAAFEDPESIKTILDWRAVQ